MTWKTSVRKAKAIFLIEHPIETLYCHYCSIKLVHSKSDSTQTHDSFTIDHVIPLWYGGASREDNYVASCRSCNIKKSKIDCSKSLSEKIDLIEEYIEDRKKVVPGFISLHGDFLKYVWNKGARLQYRKIENIKIDHKTIKYIYQYGTDKISIALEEYLIKEPNKKIANAIRTKIGKTIKLMVEVKKSNLSETSKEYFTNQVYIDFMKNIKRIEDKYPDVNRSLLGTAIMYIKNKRVTYNTNKKIYE